MEKKDEMWLTVFDKLIDGKFDDAQDIFIKVGISIDDQAVHEQLLKSMKKKRKELFDQLIKLDDSKYQLFIYSMLIDTWNALYYTIYQINASEKGPPGSKEYKGSWSESVNGYEKDFDSLLNNLKLIASLK